MSRPPLAKGGAATTTLPHLAAVPVAVMAQASGSGSVTKGANRAFHQRSPCLTHLHHLDLLCFTPPCPAMNVSHASLPPLPNVIFFILLF